MALSTACPRTPTVVLCPSYGSGMARIAGDPTQPVPGVVVEHRLQDAGTGNNWHGRDRSGAPVVVRMLRLPVDGKVRDRALLEARELIGVAHPHLVPVRDAAPTVDGIAVVRDAVPGATSLARLLSRRAALGPGEVITVGVPMFQALAAVHEAGHTHGRVRPEDILIEPGGRPMLTGRASRVSWARQGCPHRMWVSWQASCSARWRRPPRPERAPSRNWPAQWLPRSHRRSRTS